MSNILSLILIVASLGAFFGYINPTYTHIEDLTAENNQYNQALDNSKALLSERDNLLTKLKSFTQDDLNRLQTLLPDAIDGVRLIIELDSIASNYGLKIRNFSTGATNQTASNQAVLGAGNSPYGTYTLTFTTTASYQTFIAFLSALEHNLRLMDVTGVTFSAPSTNSAYDFTITINTYWLK